MKQNLSVKTVDENITENKLDIIFKIIIGKVFYCKINIFAHITEETVIRNLIDELINFVTYYKIKQ